MNVRLVDAAGLGLLLMPFLLLVLRPRNLVHLLAAVQALFMVGWAGWTWVLLRSHTWTLPLLVLPLIAVNIGARVAAFQFSKLSTNPVNTDAYRRTRFWIGAAIVFLYPTIGGLSSGTSIDSAISWTLVSLVGVAVCVGCVVLSARGGSHPLPAGPLRTRIFELASSARVRLRGVSILTGSEARPPSAFATRWGVVMLSDTLLKRLPRREVDAIVCHELSHIGPVGGAPRVLLYILVAATAMGAQLAPALVEGVPVLVLAAWLLFKAWRRSEERRADRDAVRWSGDPEALISGLARISYAHGMPLEWGAPVCWLVGHPSTEKRIQMIAAAGGVPGSRVAQLLDESRGEASDPYTDGCRISKDAAFSPLRQRMRRRLSAYVLLAPAVLGVATAKILEATGFGGLAGLAAVAALSAVAFYLGYELVVGQVRSAARRRAVTRGRCGIFAG